MELDRKKSHLRTIGRSVAAGGAALFLISSLSCGFKPDRTPPAAAQSTLTIGFGFSTGQDASAGVRQVVRNIALEGLVGLGKDGRPYPWLAESWSQSEDGLEWRFRLKEGVTFHDGRPVDAETIRAILLDRLPRELGPSFQDVIDIRSASPLEFIVSLKKRSAFLIEGLGFPIQGNRTNAVGSGPYYVSDQSGEVVEMLANTKYHGGSPSIDRIEISTYPSVRTAWAEMLRGNLDMLYEVGVDALELLDDASATDLFSFDRPYVYVLIFNFRNASIRSPDFRRLLNSAIDRKALVRDILRGHGTPAIGPVWPYHWTVRSDLSGFDYAPTPVRLDSAPIELNCLFGDPSLERMALDVQRQLREINVDLKLEMTSGGEFLDRLNSGNFDLALTDIIHGPVMSRPYLFWRSGGSYNWGQFTSAAVDDALDSIRYATDDRAYERGVVQFQRAIVDDPPAIFLAWSQRARAVSTRFEVPVEEGRDILSTLRLWRQVGPPQRAQRN